ncbi:MAG: hypothetical protein KBD76_15395 [Bacteriovorax sp.]|nr:hypothetical protein [Bacteriovorax sp.]
MQKILFTLIMALFLSIEAQAKIGLNVSLIYKKGIGKGFFLSTEQHSIEQVDEHEHIMVRMKNGIKVELSAHFVQSIHEYGPSGFVRVKGEIFNQDGKVVKTLNEPKLDIYLGQSKTISHQERNEEQIDIIITPVSLL